MAVDPMSWRFLTELLTDLLHWKWVVLINEEDEGVTPSLVSRLNARNVSTIILTSNIENSVHVLLRKFGTVPVMALLKPKRIRRKYFFRTCKIQWVIAMPNSKPNSTGDAFLKALDPNSRLNALYAVPISDGTFSMRVPDPEKLGFQSINSWQPSTGFKTSISFGLCVASSIGHLKVAMVKHIPFFKPHSSRWELRTDGVDVMLLKSLASALNFTFSFEKTKDDAWGVRNGSEWNGMIGMLVRNEADAALSGMTVTYGRHEAVEFSIPYAFDKSTFVTSMPAVRAKTWVIFWPYTSEVWALLAATVIAVAAILTWLQTRMKKRRRQKLKFGNSTLYIFQALLNQGHYNALEPRCRVLMSFWWWFCITLVAGYNGSLMSFMAHPGLNPAVDTLQRLVDAVRGGRIDVGTIRSSADFTIFSQSEEPDLRLILNNMEANPENFVFHDNTGLWEALRRPYAYVGGLLTVQADVFDHRKFLFARDAFMHYGYAIAFRPGFEHVEAFNRKILQLREAGIVQKWAHEMIERQRPKPNVGKVELQESNFEMDDEEDETNVLQMNDVQGAFAVLTIGLLASVLCFASELCVFWKKPKRRLKRRKKLS